MFAVTKGLFYAKRGEDRTEPRNWDLQVELSKWDSKDCDRNCDEELKHAYEIIHVLFDLHAAITAIGFNAKDAEVAWKALNTFARDMVSSRSDSLFTQMSPAKESYGDKAKIMDVDKLLTELEALYATIYIAKFQIHPKDKSSAMKLEWKLMFRKLISSQRRRENEKPSFVSSRVRDIEDGLATVQKKELAAHRSASGSAHVKAGPALEVSVADCEPIDNEAYEILESVVDQGPAPYRETELQHDWVGVKQESPDSSPELWSRYVEVPKGGERFESESPPRCVN